jgi:xylulokinase
MSCLLGIDVGTTGTKSALFNTSGDLIDLSYKHYGLNYPREGWAEQDAEDWWTAVKETVGEIVSRNKVSEDITGMSISANGGALVLLDENFRPLYNAVSWADSRAKETRSELEKKITERELYRICGWAWMTGLNFPTIFWFREKNYTLYKKARYFSSTVEYINHKLTDRFTIDYSNLALTEFLDIEKKGWSDRLIEIDGIEAKNLPEIVVSGELVGGLTQKAAEELGLKKGIPVIAGAHDQYCANIGAGAVNTGDCVLSCGTAWALLATSDRLLYDDNYIVHPGIHLLHDRYGLMTVVSSGGESLDWFKSSFTPDYSIKRMDEEAGGVQCGSSGLIFVPKTISRSGSASFLHIDTSHTLKHFMRSVFEGVAYANRSHFEKFRHLGLEIKKAVMIGGGAKSPVWPGIVADVSGIPVYVPEQKECACAGAAILAGVGCGIYGSIEEASGCFTGKKQREIEPVSKNSAVYQDLYGCFVDSLAYG